MRSSKHGAENNRAISGHIYTLHQRLYHALNLGTRFYDEKERKWKCTDIEIQRHVVRSISAFLDCISGDTANHPLVKDSVADIAGALVWILQYKSGGVLSIAANVVVKFIGTIPNSILQSYVLDLVHPLSSLLHSIQLEVATLCATALNLILSTLSVKKEREVWEILKETETVVHIVSNIRDFSSATMPIEYFHEMASLSSTILWRWPPSRYSVWNDAILMKVLEAISARPDFSVKIAVLKLYSALALCGNGAKKLLENGETLLQMMVQCMGSSHPLSVRMEGFKLAQCLVTDEVGFLKMVSTCCEPLVKAIVCGMSRWSLCSRKVANDQTSLLAEACRLALITRWAGEHHIYFWKQGIDRILVDLLLENFHNRPSKQSLSLEEQISVAQEGLNANFLIILRPYIWDILGWLATHCGEDFNPDMHENDLHINILITCACLAFVDSISKGRQICQNDVIDIIKSESALRAILMMIYSPSKYIASKARFILTEILKPNGKENLKQLLHSLNTTSSWHNFGLPNILQTVINLMGLTCYSGLPQYRRYVIKSEGMKTLLASMRWCLSNQVHIGRLSFAPHLHNMFGERTCCWVRAEAWEDKDIILLYCLRSLAELIRHSGSVRDNLDILSGELNCTEAQLVNILQKICCDSSSSGPRWYAAYILGFFGYHGFPSKLGKRIGKSLNEKDHTDMQLNLTNGESLSVHSVVLAVRCPALLPPEELPLIEKTSDRSSIKDNTEKCGKFHKEVRLSAHVDHQALLKLLEFVYLGYLEAGEELVKKLKTLAKRCNLQSLLQFLSRKSPKWGTPIPSSDLALALGPIGHHYSDIILEAKATELMDWTCSACSRMVPHMHVHKVILWSSCDYLQALFRSGMQESHSPTINVPISWEAMIKLVNWFYTDELPSPPSGCLWDNMDTEEKLYELQPYVELCWLAEFWLLQEIQDAASRVIVSCLDSARQLSIKVIQIAANFSLWKLAEVAADYMAPLYRKLRESGDLEELDEMLVDMVRAASVRLSQGGGNQSR